MQLLTRKYGKERKSKQEQICRQSDSLIQQIMHTWHAVRFSGCRGQEDKWDTNSHLSWIYTSGGVEGRGTFENKNVDK